jgi:hypothetical protein
LNVSFCVSRSLLREAIVTLSPHIAELLLPRLFVREAMFLEMEPDIFEDGFFDDEVISNRMCRINSMIVRAVDAAHL